MFHPPQPTDPYSNEVTETDDYGQLNGEHSQQVYVFNEEDYDTQPGYHIH